MNEEFSSKTKFRSFHLIFRLSKKMGKKLHIRFALRAPYVWPWWFSYFLLKLRPKSNKFSQQIASITWSYNSLSRFLKNETNKQRKKRLRVAFSECFLTILSKARTKSSAIAGLSFACCFIFNKLSNFWTVHISSFWQATLSVLYCVQKSDLKNS